MYNIRTYFPETYFPMLLLILFTIQVYARINIFKATTKLSKLLSEEIRFPVVDIQYYSLE